ncbi:MAG: hypothetical protein RI909_501 [Bacteroidota bacterium]
MVRIIYSLTVVDSIQVTNYNQRSIRVAVRADQGSCFVSAVHVSKIAIIYPED